jgi:hypothetical protein
MLQISSSNPISSSNFICGVKIKVGTLFKNLQQQDAGSATIRLRIRGLQYINTHITVKFDRYMPDPKAGLQQVLPSPFNIELSICAGQGKLV